MIPKIRLTVQDQYSLQQQSLIINQKFIQLIRSRQQISQNQKNFFTQNQTQIIYKRFQQLCQFGRMDYTQFRKGLGLLGRQESFLSRIFYMLDQDDDGTLTFDDYLMYLDTVMNGSQIQKARFSWMLLTQGKGQLQLQDLVDVFQEISVVWNALTGEIITPKRKYIEQLFDIFDIDQDQIITFQDYQIYFEEHPQLFGWFQYLNNFQIDDKKIKSQLSNIRKKLREKLNLNGHLNGEDISLQEVNNQMKDLQTKMQRKLLQLTQKMKYTVIQQTQKQQKILTYSKKTTLQQSQNAPLQNKFNFNLTNSLNNSRQINNSRAINNSRQISQFNNSNQRTFISINNNSLPQSQNISLKSCFKYNYQSMNNETLSQYNTQLSRMKCRRQKQQKQTKINSGIQFMKDIQSMLQQVYKMMNLCQQYRNLKQKQKKFSPSKLRQLQVKYNIVDKQLNSFQNQQNKKQKKNMTVYFGHQNWNIVLNIMVGLRKSVKSLYDLSSHLKIKDQNFSQQHQFVLGNKTTIGKDSQVYKFIQKAPLIFQRLRNIYGISNQEYQRSVGPESLLNQLFIGNLQALNQKCSTGKSGAFFYLTLDNKVFLKTIKKNQYIFFQKILKNYYEHMRNYKNTLIVRVYGLYKLKLFINKEKIKTLYFISMQNIFAHIIKQNNLRINQIYDLKGSLYGRTGGQGSQLKDQDWINNKKQIKLPLNIRQIFIDQIILDSKFFKKNNINDYSMMIAMIRLQQKSKLHQKDTQNVFKRFSGGVKSSQQNLLYVISIIDFLTSFQTIKNMQYLIKSTFLSKDVSCVPPAQYSKRFRDFILNSVAKQSTIKQYL